MQSSDSQGANEASWLVQQFETVARWSLLDVFVILNTIALVFLGIGATQYFWLTRRQPVRRDAPTDGPWTSSRDKWS